MLGSLPLLLVLSVTWSWAMDYELLLEEPDLFSPCTDGPPGSISIQEAFNSENFTISMESDILHLSGNVTSRWEVEPTDRVSARISLFYFNRGTWEPTVYSISVNNFCPLMYDRNQYWFKYWTKYVSNRHEVEHLCLSAGAVFVHNPYDMKMRLDDFRGPVLRGRHKILIICTAFSNTNVQRPVSFCFEIRGEVLRIK
ncbi:uncharacterized protein LOC110189316 [Drosophila serrata]|uniref:uncharacterized protein LOC110189316 n=1 Tax=Drosophila serrata TaxID=7274 RepID=UPI000A1D25BE|nr:uncharacterized protein LOC110189316 [Drosophila serrata]